LSSSISAAYTPPAFKWVFISPVLLALAWFILADVYFVLRHDPRL
jgi:hypothetical protein